MKAEVQVFTAADFGIEERPTMGDPELRKRVQQEVERLTGAPKLSESPAVFCIAETSKLGASFSSTSCCRKCTDFLPTGMANVKAFFAELSRTVAFVERGGDPRVLQTSLNLRLTGNPGRRGQHYGRPRLATNACGS